MSGFHGAFATGVASQQGTLTLPDTWFRPPFWDLLMLQLLRPNSSNLPCLYSTFHLEYPLVLSRFYSNTPWYFLDFTCNLFQVDYGFALQIQIETSTKMYTPFLNRIELTTWTICAFRVLNPRQ